MSRSRSSGHQRRGHWALLSCLALAAVAGAGSPAAVRGQGAALPERFTAFAVNLNASRPAARSGIVETRIDRWSTEEERAALVRALQKGGQSTLLKALRENPKVGTIRTPDSLGWDLHYAHQAPLPDGGRRIFIATDRPIRFWEAINHARSVDYPFTLVALTLDANNHGSGKIWSASKIVASKDGKFIQIEDLELEPVRLEDVKAEPAR